MLSKDLKLQAQPDKVVDSRIDSNDLVEVLIHQRDLSSYEYSWKSMLTIQYHFPNFHLEDKMNFFFKGIVLLGNIYYNMYMLEERKLWCKIRAVKD